MESKEEESFIAKVVQGGRITVPFLIREKLDIKPGSRLMIRVSKDESHTPQKRVEQGILRTGLIS